MLALCAAPAAAEPAFSLAVASDDRFRGVSTSDRLPVATVAVGYDDVRGPYVGASLTAGPVRGEGVRLLRAVQYAGYVHRIRGALALDMGVSNHVYGDYATVDYARRFTQFYVGVVARGVSSRIFYSPNYNGAHRSSVYGEVDMLLLARRNWSLNGHLGVLATPTYYRRDTHDAVFDARLGVTRSFGRLSLTASLLGASPLADGRSWRNTLLLAATRSF